MRREERRAIMGQGVVLPETPRDRRQRAALEQDVADSPLRGKRLGLRLRNFRPDADGYLLSLGGPLPYMQRLRTIDALTTEHEERLAGAWVETARSATRSSFAGVWAATAGTWSFDDVNDLIERHNRWYPAEARLPMNPRTGDYALVNGKDYRRRRLDAAWILERYPADYALATAG